MSDGPIVPMSPHGGVHPEMRARITAARLAVAGFSGEVDDYLNGDDAEAGPPDFGSWAWRLHGELKALLGLLGDTR